MVRSLGEGARLLCEHRTDGIGAVARAYHRGLEQFRLLAQLHGQVIETGLGVGMWIRQTVDWINTELEWVTDTIKWPFQFLFDLVMNENPTRDSIQSISWLWVVIDMFLLGSISCCISSSVGSSVRVLFFGSVAMIWRRPASSR